MFLVCKVAEVDQIKYMDTVFSGYLVIMTHRSKHHWLCYYFKDFILFCVCILSRVWTMITLRTSSFWRRRGGWVTWWVEWESPVHIICYILNYSISTTQKYVLLIFHFPCVKMMRFAECDPSPNAFLYYCGQNNSQVTLLKYICNIWKTVLLWKKSFLFI